MTDIGWFSGGVTSAVAIKKHLEAGHKTTIFFCETGNHHSDNLRFLKDCEKWFNQQIIVLRSAKFANVEETIRYSKYINGPDGAKCTKYLKKDLRIALEKIMPFNKQIFGFEFDKKQIIRAERFVEQYPKSNGVFPLIDAKLNKSDCMEILVQAGIELPAMYQRGYSNANCIGCIKGGMGYWNKIRKDFPEVFNKFSLIEREINGTILRKQGKKLFLDELDPNDGRHESIALPECGVVCPVEIV
jgi:3'-phosphoadenosine 5'-phosphosulfate sulfotransferase (PAPS reductase)/FAD synthetase